MQEHRKHNVLGTSESGNIVQHNVFACALKSPGAPALLRSKTELMQKINRRHMVLYKICSTPRALLRINHPWTWSLILVVYHRCM